MDRPQLIQQLQLNIPRGNSRLDFCAATPEALTAWLDSLPKANLGEYARLAYEALGQLDRLDTPASNRLQLLEVLRPEICMLCERLEPYFISQPLAMDERSHKIFSLCQALQEQLALGYKLVAVEARETPELAATGIQRAIRTLTALLVRTARLYQPPRTRLWLELHLLYELALSYHIQHFGVAEPLAHPLAEQRMTVEQSYLAAVLLASARTNQLRPEQIAQLAGRLDSWSSLPQLKLYPDSQCLLVIDPHRDSPPRYHQPGDDSAGPGCWGIDTRPLAAALTRQLDQLAPLDPTSLLYGADEVDPELLRHLRQSCGGMVQRSFPRSMASGTLNACLGMAAVHYQLAGGQNLEQMQKNRPAPLFSIQQRPEEAWAGVYENSTRADRGQPLTWLEQKASRQTAENPPSARETPDQCFSLQLVDQSAEGFCLNWPGQAPALLQVGELLGLQENGSPGWLLAIVRWIRHPAGGQTQLGVQLLSSQARACGLRLLQKEGPAGQYLRALLLPANPGIRSPATLITPRLPFRENSKVQVLEGPREYRALLVQRLKGCPAYNFFEYQSLEPGDSPPANHPARSGKEEDFSALWSSL